MFRNRRHGSCCDMLSFTRHWIQRTAAPLPNRKERHVPPRRNENSGSRQGRRVLLQTWPGARQHSSVSRCHCEPVPGGKAEMGRWETGLFLRSVATLATQRKKWDWFWAINGEFDWLCKPVNVDWFVTFPLEMIHRGFDIVSSSPKRH